MGKILPVTSSQGSAIRDMGNEKKVGRARWQRAHDDGRFARFLDSLKDLVPPPGCRMHILRVMVTLDQPWQDAVNAAGPDTPANYNVRKVGDLYVPTGTGEEEQEHILLNYPGGSNWEPALAWAKREELEQTLPREVFAIGRQYPELHRILGLNSMYVVATTECFFDGRQQACCVWWYDSERRAHLDCVEFFDYANVWFAFRKPSASDLKP